MSAAAANPFGQSRVPVLPAQTSPAAIREGLVDQERVEFERAYREGLEHAAQSLELEGVLEVLRNYHRTAWCTAQQGRTAHQRMLDKATEIVHTGHNPDGVSIEQVRERILASRCTYGGLAPLLRPRRCRTR